MNRVIISGTLLYKPRITITQTGVCRASIFLSVPRNHGEPEGNDYITAVAWERQAEDIRDYATQGDFIEIDGIIRTRTVVKERKNYVQEIVAKNVGFPERKPEKNVNK